MFTVVNFFKFLMKLCLRCVISLVCIGPWFLCPIGYNSFHLPLCKIVITNRTTIILFELKLSAQQRSRTATQSPEGKGTVGHFCESPLLINITIIKLRTADTRRFVLTSIATCVTLHLRIPDGTKEYLIPNTKSKTTLLSSLKPASGNGTAATSLNWVL